MKLLEALKEVLGINKVKKDLPKVRRFVRFLIDPRTIFLGLSFVGIAWYFHGLPSWPPFLVPAEVGWIYFWGRVFRLWDAPYLGKWGGEAAPAGSVV